MSVAPGIIIRASPYRLINVFIIDNIQFTFSSVVHTPLPPFDGTEAHVSFESSDDLTLTRSYQGSIEDGELKLQLDNGSTIIATILPPLDVGPIEGEGVWKTE